jgi:hypothetical protein
MMGIVSAFALEQGRMRSLHPSYALLTAHPSDRASAQVSEQLGNLFSVLQPEFGTGKILENL